MLPSRVVGREIRQATRTHISNNSPSDISNAQAIAYTVLIDVFKMLRSMRLIWEITAIKVHLPNSAEIPYRRARYLSW